MMHKVDTHDELWGCNKTDIRIYVNSLLGTDKVEILRKVK